jgi:hypothetical protein
MERPIRKKGRRSSAKALFDALRNDFGHPALVAYPGTFHVGLDIERHIRVQPKLPGYPRSFMEKFLGGAGPKRSKPAKDPTGGPEPQVASVGLLQPSAEFHPGIACLRSRNIEAGNFL